MLVSVIPSCFIYLQRQVSFIISAVLVKKKRTSNPKWCSRLAHPKRWKQNMNNNRYGKQKKDPNCAVYTIRIIPSWKTWAHPGYSKIDSLSIVMLLTKNQRIPNDLAG
jgi:hypothetical protein